MIFAHAPFGILFAYFSKKIWAKNISRRQYCWLFVITALGSIFPDIDLFYYYLFSATFSHHEILTHGFFVYLAVCAILFFIGYLLKNQFIQKASCFFLLGILSHLLADSISAGVIWLAPFTYKMYGLANLDWYGRFFGLYYFTLNYSLEIFFSSIFILLILHKLIKSRKIFLTAVALILLIDFICFFGLYYVNLHLYRTPSDIYYSDYDNDSVANRYDFDIDGDAIMNIDDPDIDGDGISNKRQLYEQTKKTAGIYYDITEGGLLEIPLRMGFVTNTDLIRRILDTQGIFLKEEMMADYEKNPQDYATNPQKDPAFDRNASNWQAWLEHINRLENYSPLQTGDILFMADQTVAIVVASSNDNEIKKILAKEYESSGLPHTLIDDYKILIASAEKKKVINTNIYLLNLQHGNIIKIGRLLSD